MELTNYPSKYWHCSILKKGSKQRPSVINDLTLEKLYDEIIEPWYQNRRFTITGTIINSQEDIDEIRIVQTDEQKDYFEHEHNVKMIASNVVDMITDPRMLPFSKGKDYTNEILFKKGGKIKNTKVEDGKKIFVVHGRDEQIKETVARFIEKLELEAVILHEQPSGGKTIIEKFEKYSDVQFAVILLTPDDFGGSKENTKAISNRARQNVIFELGFFIGKYGRDRVCALVKDKIEYPSDYTGVIYIGIDSKGAWKMELAKEMKQAGLEVDLNKVI